MGFYMDKLMTLPELADYLRMSKHSIYKLVEKGILPGSKLGGIWRFKKSRIDHWVDEMENTKRKKMRRRV